MSGRQTGVVVITGAAGNLGRAAAAAFAKHGARLVLIDVSTDLLEAAYPSQRDDHLLVAEDLTDEKAAARAVAIASDRFGPIDVLCNIAGGFHYGEPVHRMNGQVWSRMLDLNAVTLINMAKAVVPGMLQNNRKGTVINVGASGHVQGHAQMSAYAVAKSAVMRLTESMAEELDAHSINVFCVMPNVIDTPQNRREMPEANFQSWTATEKIAEVMLLLTDDATAPMSGCSIALKGRASAPSAA